MNLIIGALLMWHLIFLYAVISEKLSWKIREKKEEPCSLGGKCWPSHAATHGPYDASSTDDIIWNRKTSKVGFTCFSVAYDHWTQKIEQKPFLYFRKIFLTYWIMMDSIE